MGCRMRYPISLIAISAILPHTSQLREVQLDGVVDVDDSFVGVGGDGRGA